MTAETSEVLAESILRTAEGFSGRLGVWAHNLETGEEVAVGADGVFDTASVIKLPVLYEVFRQIELGRFSLDDTVVLTRENMVLGSGVLKEFDEGHRLSVREAVTLMVIVSDNSATNLCIDQVGGWPAANAAMDTLGLAKTRLHRKVFIPDPKALGPGLGATTPREMGVLLLKIAAHEVLSPASCDMILGIMARQQFKDMLTRDIDEKPPADAPPPPPDAPPAYRLANKGGWVRGVRNEVGLFTTGRGRYVVSVFTNGSTDPRFHPLNEGVQLVGRVSRLVYDVWGRA